MEMEDFKRPDHPDFMTSVELKRERFSGVRLNSITNERELWIEGYVVVHMSETAIQANPVIWDSAYKKVFKLD